jgi:hypothetical protein
MAILTASISAGTYFIDNYCPFTMYLQSGPIVTNGTVPLVYLPANTSNAYLEIMLYNNNRAQDLNLSRTPDMADPMQASYDQSDIGPSSGYNFYALSTVFGDPFMAEGFQLLTESNGTSVNCPPRSAGQDCPSTITPETLIGDAAELYVPNSEDLRLTLCMFNQNATADSA